MQNHIDDVEVPIVVSYCNKFEEMNYENTRRLVETLKRNEWNYVILGKGEKWVNFMTKIKACHKYLKTLNPNKVVVITDAHDVYCLRNVHYFMNEFKTLNASIVTSMEMFAEGKLEYNSNETYQQVEWLGPYFEHHDIKITENDISKKFINGGLICGYAKDLIHLNEWMLEHGYTDDQKAIGAYANTYPDTVLLDFNSKLLHTCTSSVNFGLHTDAQRLDSPSIGELFGHSSYFIHIPGLNCGGGQPILYDVVYDVITKYNSNIANSIPSYQYDYVRFKKYHNENKILTDYM
ncbi:MAG: hypothetical protein FJX80_09415 [Bacteroidetes bacterium]|nr:hypothetical protein [Bacteroidota bacterium]